MQEKVPDSRPTLPFGFLTEEDVRLLKAKSDYSQEIRAYREAKENNKKLAAILSYIIVVAIYFVLLLPFGYLENRHNIFMGILHVLLDMLVPLIFIGLVIALVTGRYKHPNWFAITRFFWFILPFAFVDKIAEFFCKRDIPNYDFLVNYNLKKDVYKRYLLLCDLYDHEQIKEKQFKAESDVDRLRRLKEKLSTISGVTHRSEHEWRAMTDRQFEIEIGGLYERMGYQTHVTRQSNDGGVDVILTKNGVDTYVQCKHYSCKTYLGVVEMRAFYGVCMARGVKGIMICTGELTNDAKDFARAVSSTLRVVRMGELLRLEEKFYEENPINLQRSFTSEFLLFIKDNNFVDCNHLWLQNHLYYDKHEATMVSLKMTRWTHSDYMIKEVVLTQTITAYVVLLVNTYAKREVECLKLVG